jgi:sarcosine oxidase subunit gamma
MVERVSALAGHLDARQWGMIGEAGPGVRLSERRLASLWQIAAWPDRLAEVAEAAAEAAGAAAAPAPGASAEGTTGTLFRTEALKWQLAGARPIAEPALPEGAGTVLDLSHARTVIRVEGPATEALMARLAAVDLRERAFPEGAVAATGMHHVSVMLHRRAGGIEIHVFRSFALSLWEHIGEVAAQFGAEVA